MEFSKTSTSDPKIMIDRVSARRVANQYLHLRLPKGFVPLQPMEINLRIANMATFPARAERLKASIESVLPQVDVLNICLNEYEAVPEWLSLSPKINAVIPDRDMKDLGKFIFSADADDDVVLVDDDILYPIDYVEHSLRTWEVAKQALGRPCVGGYHGTIYQRYGVVRLIKDVLKRRGIKRAQFGHAKILHAYHTELRRARIVTQVGTGTTVLKGSQIPPIEFMTGAERRADVRFARWCHEQSLPIVVLPRQAGWMPCDEEEDVLSIWATYTSSLPKEVRAELRSFALDVPHRGTWVGA